MRRLTRAIAEIESFRNTLIRSAWHSPSELVILGLLNAAATALAQVQVMVPTTMRRGDIDMNPDRAAELIAQINDEIRDDQTKGEDL